MANKNGRKGPDKHQEVQNKEFAKAKQQYEPEKKVKKRSAYSYSDWDKRKSYCGY